MDTPTIIGMTINFLITMFFAAILGFVAMYYYWNYRGSDNNLKKRYFYNLFVAWFFFFLAFFWATFRIFFWTTSWLDNFFYRIAATCFFVGIIFYIMFLLNVTLFSHSKKVNYFRLVLFTFVTIFNIIIIFLVWLTSQERVVATYGVEWIVKYPLNLLFGLTIVGTGIVSFILYSYGASTTNDSNLRKRFFRLAFVDLIFFIGIFFEGTGLAFKYFHETGFITVRILLSIIALAHTILWTSTEKFFSFIKALLEGIYPLQ